MKVLITGGHITPALAVIEQLQQKKDVRIIFVGRKYAQDTEDVLSLEYKEIEKRQIPFISLQAGRLTRLLTLHSLKNLLKVPYGFVKAFTILKREKPDVILSFGGYVALPVAYAAYLRHIPVYTHEQTLRPGMANILISKVAKKIFVSFDEARPFFDSNKVTLTGNPLRTATFEVRSKPFTVTSNRQVIYVTGGSLGSHSINMHIKNLLQELLKKYVVIHQTGDTKKYKDFEELEDIRTHLPQELKKNYYIRKHFLEDEVGYIYSVTDMVVGRAGANTFFELVALEKPAVLIPLPWSAYHEQQKQADIFKKHKIGEVFNQAAPSRELMNLIDKVSTHLYEYKKPFEDLKFLYKENAAHSIARQILES